ncbi:unnamed protein product [Merluccius merluccius]
MPSEAWETGERPTASYHRAQWCVRQLKLCDIWPSFNDSFNTLMNQLDGRSASSALLSSHPPNHSVRHDDRHIRFFPPLCSHCLTQKAAVLGTSRAFVRVPAVREEDVFLASVSLFGCLFVE